ncbi:PREDICTED: abnormal spindle-like microcephaly-associated protein homolog [Rhagoletis zephyria]|uniref:abnormal spindle-like microcephaly-associated protein homolog n=1 Tax=Rhagoletis zephyria TaxID=28612 RepID=UPI0008113FCE|nr:PREDICTED: abnormal spindle-like microcephaly-associated protein homolog [Rhagoletis zephyria]XP_036342750.1 abnormal spindle-like microcephaly-associated protein homolog [Rhagoletis pomonella]
MHIHPSSPNSDFDAAVQTEENAAIKIQAGFRGYRVRKQMHHQPQTNALQHFQQQSPEQSINRTSQKINQPTNSYSSSPDLESITHEDRYATKIQAGVRGYLVRKKQKIATEAATKIQASFRGFKARKETQKMKQN